MRTVSIFVFRDVFEPARIMSMEAQGGHIVISFSFFIFPCLFLAFWFSLRHLAFRLRFRFLFFSSVVIFNVLIFTSPFCFSVEISVFIFLLFHIFLFLTFYFHWSISFYFPVFLFAIKFCNENQNRSISLSLFSFAWLLNFFFHLFSVFVLLLNYMVKTKTKAWF